MFFISPFLANPTTFNLNESKGRLLTYSLVLHCTQMRMASICGDIILSPELEGLTIPSSRATPAWVAIPPRLELLKKSEDYQIF
jgi:hypothetical protein